MAMQGERPVLTVLSCLVQGRDDPGHGRKGEI